MHISIDSVEIYVDERESGLVVFQEDGTHTKGEPPVLIHESKHCDDCGQEHEFEKCPQCGAWIYVGHGLIGGGFGLFKVCDGDPPCDWVWKRFDPVDA